MIGRQIVVSTCGTSLLTNAARGPGQRELLAELQRHGNDTEDELPREVLARFRHHADRTRAEALAIGAADGWRLSAEINGLLRLYGAGVAAKARLDTHFLVHSDTWEGQAAAEIGRDWLAAHGISAQVHCVDCLTAANTEAFTLGTQELVRFCEGDLRDSRGPGDRIVFHLSGGWKSLQGFMTVLGMVYADELVYIHEFGELLRIPRLPVQLDPDGVLAARPELARRIALQLPCSAEEVAGLPESLLYPQAGGFQFSPWGLAAWARGRRAVYQSALLPSPTPPVKYGDRFSATAAPFRGQRHMADINDCIDKLVQYVVFGRPTRGLDLKGLRDAEAFAPSTHECDAWHDGGAGRLFGHWDRDVFVLDRVHGHLG